MPQLEFLQDLVIIFGVSIGVVLLFHRLHLPSIIGFLISGAMLGPYGLNLIDDAGQVEVLAEVGVVLLLFTIGLEFSLTRLSRIRSFALTGGALQVGLTVAAAAVAALAFGVHFRAGIFWGFLLALSSTAIVLKMLLDRGEIDSPHGRLTVGILIFQDLIMVPMMLSLPLLSESPNGRPLEVILALGRSVLLLGAILAAARWLVPKALSLVVRSRSRELFIITVILICLGIAWLSALSGLSLALGAFIAGLVISESEFSHQALADIMPFRDSFNSLFFISIGMLLDWRFFLVHPVLIPVAAIIVILLKGVIAGGVTVGLGYPSRVAVLVGLSLVQVGEFSFVLATAGQEFGMLVGDGYQLFLAISILTMMATPFLILLGPHLTGRTDWIREVPAWLRRPRTADLEPQDLVLKDHVIVAGYGLNGRNLARVLKETNIPYAILDLHGETVRHHRDQGEPIYFGDVTRALVLRRLRIQDAKLLVLAVSDPFAVRRAVRVARAENPDLTIIVRTRYVTEVEDLIRLGADQVVPEEFETSLEIFDRVLRRYDVPAAKIDRKKAEVRRESYAKLRRGEIEPVVGTGTLPGELQIERFAIREGSSLTREMLSEIDLPAKTGTLVAAVIRGEETLSNPRGSFRVQPGDVLVVLGNREALSRAKVYFEESTETGAEGPEINGTR